MKIPDPVPVGYIRLTEMWEKLTATLWGTTSPIVEIQSVLRTAMLPIEVFSHHHKHLNDVTNTAFKLAVSPFLSGILEARVKFPDETELYRIPSVEWDNFFPERMFMSDIIEAG